MDVTDYANCGTHNAYSAANVPLTGTGGDEIENLSQSGFSKNGARLLHRGPETNTGLARLLSVLSLGIMTRITPAFVIFCFLALSGCLNPYEPHPVNTPRLVFIGSTPLAFVTRGEFIDCDGYFESSLTLHIDSTNSRYETDASFFNHLGNEYLPAPPFSIFANGNMLFDTAARALNYSGQDSLVFMKPISWQVQGGQDEPSFNDSIMSPQTVRINFPVPNVENAIPREAFSIRYDVIGSDSVYFKLLIFSIDTMTNYFAEKTFHVQNTGLFDIGGDIISAWPPKAGVHIFLAAISQKKRDVSGRLFFIRSGIIDNANVKFTN